jgi:hypothetical protein
MTNTSSSPPPGAPAVSADSFWLRAASAAYRAPRSGARAALLVAAVTLAVAYGGIRSPDSEVMYRTAERLAYAGTFAHETDLEGWKDFGLPKGLDGKRYQWFGPGQSIYEAPFVRPAAAAGRWLAETFPDLDPPPSHYYRGGLGNAYKDRAVPQEHLAGHLERSLISLLDVLTLALTAVFLFRVFRLLLPDDVSAGWATVATALGTPLLSYATTLMSEPLATLGYVIALLNVMRGDPDFAGDAADPRLRRMVYAALAVSIAAAVHVTAILYAPLLGIYAWRNARLRAGAWWGRALIPPVVMTLSTFPVVLWVCRENWLHFGDPFETGRGVMPEFWVEGFVAPWEGFVGQTISPGKGLFWFAPLATASFVAGLAFWRKIPWLGRALVVYVALRLCFLAGRADWHAGFCLGPRYMMMAMPDFVVVGVLAWRALHARLLVSWTKRLGMATVVIALAVAQQLYFASGEIFLFTHKMRDHVVAELRQGRPARLYFDWDYSPLWNYLHLSSGPALFRALGIDARVGCALFLALTALVAWLAYLGATKAAAVVATRAAR